MDIQIDRQITVDNEGNIPSIEQIQLWAQTAFDFAKYNEDCAFTARFTTPEEVHSLNKQYRNVDRPTNILSFPYEEPEDLPEEIKKQEDHSYLGDLVICMEILEKEAQEQHKTLIEHSAHLIIHGCLHLLGFDHITDEEAQEMEGLEIQILDKLGYANPYEEC